MEHLSNRDIALWTIAGLILSIGIYNVFWVQTNSFQCVSNPYIYSINLLEKSNRANVTAVFSVDKFPPVSVLLTRNGFSADSQNINTSIASGINGNKQ